MAQAVQAQAGYFTAAAAGTGVAVPMAGDTFAVANFALTSSAYLESVWAEGASTDFVRIRSPRMHDNNQGLRLVVAGISPVDLIGKEVEQPLYPGDALTVEIDETAVATGAVATLNYYEDLPGVAPRLASWADISGRIKNISGTVVALGAIAAIGQYSAGTAINATNDNFKADTDYALLGYLTAASVLSIAVSGQDTGNLKTGGPGITDARSTRNWFADLAEAIGKPCIPLIAANNKGSTLVFQTDNTAHAAQNVTLILAELG